MPLYVYLLHESWHYTSNKKKFINRLAFWGVVSLYPTYLIFSKGNILLNFAFTLAIVYEIESKETNFIAVSSYFLFLHFCEYSHLPLIFFYFLGSGLISLRSSLLFLAAIINIQSTISFLLINCLSAFSPHPKGKDFLISDFHYIFYPTHIYFLWMLQQYLPLNG